MRVEQLSNIRVICILSVVCLILCVSCRNQGDYVHNTREDYGDMIVAYASAASDLCRRTASLSSSNSIYEADLAQMAVDKSCKSYASTLFLLALSAAHDEELDTANKYIDRAISLWDDNIELVFMKLAIMKKLGLNDDWQEVISKLRDESTPQSYIEALLISIGAMSGEIDASKFSLREIDFLETISSIAGNTTSQQYGSN